ncbi:MAG: RNA-binding protein [Bacillota bacterium]
MSSAREIQPGQLVCSKSGRDKDRCYLVLKVIDQYFVHLVDGDVRKLDRPKRKNIKHLQVLPTTAGELAEKLKAGESITNAEVRQAISQTIGNG